MAHRTADIEIKDTGELARTGRESSGFATALARDASREVE
jgi:hypothetical protein